ncbi:MAG: hypothetical protein U5S82_21060 [Gammaproteobacteria bacterium]|nr:hypothetical protein [Gammaproteobacteria bacterium]
MMSVVFDEVVTQVETPPKPADNEQTPSNEQPSPHQRAHCWQQQQATFWRRKLRLEAD